ncbi:MAG: tetratricopeptide repeat protein [Hyphomicrobiaceae bacterium]
MAGIVVALGLGVAMQPAGDALAADRGARRPPASFGGVTFKSQKEAYNNGISAYLQGNYAVALPAFEYSAQNGWLPSKFYLAQIFADNAGPYTDHARAYNLYREIVETAANDTDPDDYHMARIVSQSIVALGRYTHSGLSKIGVKPDPIRAAELFNFAANRLNDSDAQYELAKMLLVGDGIAADAQLALHFISRLSQRGHTSAQASMAEIFAQGRFVDRNMVEALALIELALRNAPARDRFWIAEIYQRIFCGSSRDVQEQASGLVAGWQKKYGKPSPPSRDSSLEIDVNPRRECKDGVQVPSIAPPAVGPGLHRSAPGNDSVRTDRDGTLLTVERQGPNGRREGGVSVMQGGTAPVFGLQSGPVGRR